MTKKPVAVVLLCTLALVAQSAKLPADEMTMSAQPFLPILTLQSQSNLVQLTAIVRDGRGQMADGLTRENFKVFDDGQLQTISGFAIEHGAPVYAAASKARAAAAAMAPRAPGPNLGPERWVAFYFDDVGSNAGDLNLARSAAKKLLAEPWSARQHVGIFTASGQNTSDFSQDRDQVLAALDGMASHALPAISGPCPIDPGLTYDYEAEHGGSDALRAIQLQQQYQCNHLVTADLPRQIDQAWDAYLGAAQISLVNLDNLIHLMSRRSGDKTIVILASSLMPESQDLRSEQTDVIRAALRVGVVVSSVDTKGIAAPGPAESRRGGPSVTSDATAANGGMAELAEQTGGELHQLNNDLFAGMRDLSSPPEVRYLLAFNPSNSKADGSFHNLKVQVEVQGHYDVQTRVGYIAPLAPSATADADLQQKLDQETFAHDHFTDIGTDVKVMPAVTGDHKPGANLYIGLDPNTLFFNQTGGRNVESITFLSALLDRRGQFVVGRLGSMSLRLKDDTLHRVSKPGEGIWAAIEIPVQPGQYTLREVVVESNQRKMATFTADITVK